MSSSPDGDTPNARNRWLDPEATVTTDIIPFNEFGKLGDLEFHHNSAFDRESQVIHAPELDDMADTDDLIPLRLAVPSEFRPEPRNERRSSHAYRAQPSPSARPDRYLPGDGRAEASDP